MDIEDLLEYLREHKVVFLIIGATAFPVHGYTRMTFDIDFFIKATRDNAERLLTALSEFGYDVDDLTVKDIMSKKVLIRQYALEIDIHPFVKGVAFDEVWKNKVLSKIGNTSTYFASLEDLIKMKRIAGRNQDLEDLKYLLKLKEDKD